jgi:hypothetical protein
MPNAQRKLHDFNRSGLCTAPLKLESECANFSLAPTATYRYPICVFRKGNSMCLYDKLMDNEGEMDG